MGISIHDATFVADEDMDNFEISFQIEITIRMCKVSSAELNTIEDAQKCYYSELDE